MAGALAILVGALVFTLALLLANAARRRARARRRQRGFAVLVAPEPLGGNPAHPGAMGDTPRPLQIPLPGGSGRAPTGAVQFEDDWPGLFVRGDNAIVMAASIRILQERLRDTEDVTLASQLHKLATLAEIVERDVKVGGG